MWIPPPASRHPRRTPAGMSLSCRHGYGITEEAKVRAENIAKTMFDQADKKAGIKRKPRVKSAAK